MRAGWRLGIAIWAAGLMLGPAPVLAEDATQATQPAPSDAIGPRELQNFSLNGTVTRPAEPVATPRSAPPPSTPRTNPPAPSANRPQAPGRPTASERATSAIADAP